MNCRDFREIIDSYLSDELLTETNHDVLRHLESCADCRTVIEARREIRTRLRSAVINAPQYQIGKNFTHNLRTQLEYEALGEKQTRSLSWFNFKSLTLVAAGLILTFTLGIFLFSNNQDQGSDLVASNQHTIPNLSPTNLTNIALGDHEFCAVEHKREEPVSLAKTPAKYENISEVVMSPLNKLLKGSELIESHTCKYKNTNFTHFIVKNQDNLLSVMITALDDADKLKDQGILNLTSDKYQVARFDLNNEAVFVISNFDKQKNFQAAQAIYEPLQKYLYEEKYIKTAFLMFR